MKEWEKERAEQYPHLWPLAKVLTETRYLTADESSLLQRLEALAHALPVQKVMAAPKSAALLLKSPPAASGRRISILASKLGSRTGSPNAAGKAFAPSARRISSWL